TMRGLGVATYPNHGYGRYDEKPSKSRVAMDLRRTFVSTVFAVLAVAASAAPIESTLLAPVRPVVDFATLDQVKPFQHVPTYKLESGLQIVDPSGWTDTNDFHAVVAILWNEN